MPTSSSPLLAQVGDENPTRIIFPLILFLYLVAVIVLINLLIAAMTETYQKVKESAELYWMYERAQLIQACVHASRGWVCACFAWLGVCMLRVVACVCMLCVVAWLRGCVVAWLGVCMLRVHASRGWVYACFA